MQKFLWKEEKIIVVAGTPVTNCSFLKLYKLEIQEVLQGSSVRRIAFNLFQSSVVFYIETSYLVYTGNKMIGFLAEMGPWTFLPSQEI